MLFESKSETNKAWNLYRLFYIAQSTAFIVPILYIYLQNHLGLTPEEILQISSIYSILSLFLELPCAVIADRFGSKSNLYICLSLQITSCLSLLLINNQIAYHLYLICIYTASALCAGASSVLIKKQFLAKSDKEFNDYMFNLQNSFYKTTSLFIILSSLLYTLHPSIPFVLQVINFILSFYCLLKIPEKFISIKKSSKNLLMIAKNDVFKSLAFIKHENYYIFLITCSIIFGLGIDINHKSIQSQIYSLVDHHQIFIIGCIIAIGNLFSSIGAKITRQYFLEKFSRSIELFLLGMLLVIAYTFLSFKTIYLTVFGFMLINIFKGCYRPILSAEMINRYPFVNSLNTNLAVTHFIYLVLASLIQYSVSFSYVDIENGNFLYAILSFITVTAAYFYSRRNSEWKIKCGKGLFTEKEGYIEKNKEGVFFLQLYPRYITVDYVTRIAKIAELGRYPAKPLLPFIYKENQVGIRTHYLGDLHLSDVIDPGKQFMICQHILNESEHKAYPEIEKVEIFTETSIFNSKLLEMLQKETRLSKKGIIHGDLNPENILVFNDSPYVIDWDLSTEGPFWFDLLSLLSHPHLYFEKEKRIFLFLRHVDFMTTQEVRSLFAEFCKYKSMQIKKNSLKNKYFEILAKKYEEHAKDYYKS